MDEWVTNKLSQWNLDKLKDIFEENEVDEESFECLSEQIIKEMIPKLGPQSKFLKMWKLEFQSETKTADNGQIVTIPLLPDPGNDNLSNNNLDDISQVSHQEETMECNPVIIDTFPYDSEILINTCNPITDLFEFLKSNIQGLTVLNYYKNHRTLNDFYRNFLADIIVLNEMQTNHSLMINPERLIELALVVPQLFVLELSSTYYVPYSKEGKKRILARGKFHNRYSNWREKLLESGSTPNCRGLKRKIIDHSLPVRLGKFQDIFKIDCIPPHYEDQLEFLRHNVDPWKTVKNYWEKTSIKRVQDLILNSNITSTDYISTYPALRHIYDGLKLINIDFINQYPGKATSLLDNYKILEKKIFIYCEKKSKKSIEIKAQLDRLKENINESDDTRSAIIFRWLPLLLPAPPVITAKDKSSWRPTKEAVADGFILHVTNELELNVKLEERKERFKKFGLPVQPLPVLIGDSITNITNRLVIINDTKYEADSTLECVDLTFKSSYSLQLEFPRDAVYPWIFLKDAVYEIECDSDKAFPSVDTLINDLKRIQT